ncbi:MAG: hypothetical protein IKY99_08700, partial [Bacteroidaceae bacterium]|nr:hypothetical protein [Bacteroidaceae bacterium]
MLPKKIYQIEENYDLFDKEFEEDSKIRLKEVTRRVIVPALYQGFLKFIVIPSNEPVAALGPEKKFALVATDGYGTPLTPFEYDMIECKHHTSSYSCY